MTVYQTSNGYVPTFFESVDLQLLENTQFFIPDRGFLLISLILGMFHCLFFQGLKNHRFLQVCANFLFSGVYLNLLFNVRVGPSLDFSCLMSNIFVITLIIRITKTTCFNNTILMAEHAGKRP